MYELNIKVLKFTICLSLERRGIELGISNCIFVTINMWFLSGNGMVAVCFSLNFLFTMSFSHFPSVFFLNSFSIVHFTYLHFT